MQRETEMDLLQYRIEVAQYRFDLMVCFSEAHMVAPENFVGRVYFIISAPLQVVFTNVVITKGIEYHIQGEKLPAFMEFVILINDKYLPEPASQLKTDMY